MNILIISGTNREGSMSLKMSKKVLKGYLSAGADAKILDLRDLPEDIFRPGSYGKNRPESFKPFQKLVLEADGIVFVIPEYNGSYPGVLKYFIDLWEYPASFENRCVAYIGIAAGIWGGLRSVEHLQGVMGYRNAFQFNERVFVNKLYQRWDWEGGPLKKIDEKEYDINELLESQTRNFIDFCKSNKR